MLVCFSTVTTTEARRGTASRLFALFSCSIEPTAFQGWVDDVATGEFERGHLTRASIFLRRRGLRLKSGKAAAALPNLRRLMVECSFASMVD